VYVNESRRLWHAAGMSAADPLLAVRDAIVRGLSFDEPLVVATGLRPMAEVDPTARSRAELVEEARRANNKVAGAMLRVNDRWSSMTSSAGANEPDDQSMQRAREATVGGPGSTAVRLVRCWVDVPREASFLYVSDRRWLVTMTVAAARDWRSLPPEPEPTEGLVRDLGKAARQLSRSLTNDTALTKGLELRAPNGATALVVVWSAPLDAVTATTGAHGVWLAFTDGSGLWLKPGRPEWPLDERIEALRIAGVTVGAA
jgi:hypothetical protein